MSYGFILGMQQVWVALAPEYDWVLEYRYWLVYGTRAVGLLIFAAFLVQRWTKQLS